MSIVILTLKSVAYLITEPNILIIIVFVGVMLAKKNRKILLMQKMILGKEQNSLLELTLSQIVIGILLGTIGSVILSSLGAVFSLDLGLVILLCLSLIMYFIKPRFSCIAFSGGILGIIIVVTESLKTIFPDLLIGIPNLNIDIPSLIALIAVVHFIEGIGVIIDGKRGAIPVFSKIDGVIVGGFSFTRNWVIPLSLLFFINEKSLVNMADTIKTPSYWPILNISIPPDIFAKSIITLVPLIGLVGYQAVTFTRSKEEKTIFSGLLLMFYGCMLFVFSQIAYINILIKTISVLMAPLGHEVIYQFEKWRELNNPPKYTSSIGKYSVLQVSKDSPAEEMGLKSGDVILEINDKVITEDKELVNIERKAGSFLWIKVLRKNGSVEEISYNKMNSFKRLGIVFVPRLDDIEDDSLIINLDQKDNFKDIINKFKNGDEDK